MKFVVEEKLDAEKKLQDVETNLSNTEDEYAQLKLLYETNIEEHDAQITQKTMIYFSKRWQGGFFDGVEDGKIKTTKLKQLDYTSKRQMMKWPDPVGWKAELPYKL